MNARTALAWSVAALLALALAPCLAQSNPARFDRGVLWRIEKVGLPVSYLLGTIHIPDQRLLELPPPVVGAFKAAEQVATEIAMDMDNLKKLMLAMVYTDGRTLESVAGKPLYGELTARLAKLGVQEQLAQHLKPWAAMTLLVAPPRSDAIPMDMLLYQAAGEAGKKQAALETIAEQVALFEADELEHQLVMLREVVGNFDKVAALAERMVRAYLDRNLGELSALASQEDLLSTEEARRFNRRMQERMIERRNVIMAERMEPLLARSSTLVAVGALHLPGNGGLLALLESRGYRVTRADD